VVYGARPAQSRRMDQGDASRLEARVRFDDRRPPLDARPLPDAQLSDRSHLCRP
jgi:hypothetical protein